MTQLPEEGSQDRQLSFTFTYRYHCSPFFRGRRYPSSVPRSIASESIREVYVHGVGRWREPEDKRDTRGRGLARRGLRGWFLREMFRSQAVGFPLPTRPEVPQHNLRPSGPSLSHPSAPHVGSSLILCFHEHSPPPISGVTPPPPPRSWLP